MDRGVPKVVLLAASWANMRFVCSWLQQFYFGLAPPNVGGDFTLGSVNSPPTFGCTRLQERKYFCSKLPPAHILVILKLLHVQWGRARTHCTSHVHQTEASGAHSKICCCTLAHSKIYNCTAYRMHGAHHKSPFEGNYCIVSGLWNPLLDDSRFFRRLEDFFYATTKVEPRCWYPPEADWAEQETPKA